MSIADALGHLADVRAGRERPLRSGEDDAADRLVAVELLEPRDQLLHERLGKRVQLLRAG